MTDEDVTFDETPEEDPFSDVEASEEDLPYTDVTEANEEIGDEEPPPPLNAPDEVEEPDDEPGPDEAGVPEDEPEPEEPGPDDESEPKATGKGSTVKRDYCVFEEVSEDTFQLRTKINAYNGNAATREAFKRLYADSVDEERVLVVVPERRWRPRTVEGRKKANVSINVA